jgi:hypothetical protein
MPIENYKGEEFNFEYDSSPSVFAHYINDKIFNQLPQNVLEQLRPPKMDNLDLNISWNKEYYYLRLKFTGDDYGSEMGSDIVFNFNYNHYPLLSDAIKNHKGSLKDFELLDKCIKKHNNIVNVALMPVKTYPKFINNRTGRKTPRHSLNQNKGSYWSFDRPDLHIKRISTVYNKGIPANCIIENNKNYILEFNDIYDYCSRIYGLNEQKIVDSFIDFAERYPTTKKLIESLESVRGYLNLAKNFWDTRQIQYT